MPTKIVYTDADGKPVEVDPTKIDWSQVDFSDYTEDFPIDRLPKAWQSDIRKLRRENAAARTGAKEKPADKDGAPAVQDDSRVQRLELELARERVMRKHKLSDDEAALLRGETPEELTEYAEKLVSVLGSRKTEPKEDGKEGASNGANDEGKPPAGSGTPKPRLREAGTDTDTEAFDPEAIAKDIAASRGGL